MRGDRVRLPHLRQTYIHRSAPDGEKCVEIGRLKKNYFAKFEKNGAKYIFCSFEDIEKFKTALEKKFKE